MSDAILQHMSTFRSEIILKYNITNVNSLHSVYRCWLPFKTSGIENVQITSLYELFLILRLINCHCLDVIPVDLVINGLLPHLWTRMNCNDTCGNIIAIYNYYILMRRYPTDDELNTFLENEASILEDPGDYCNEHKITIPVRKVNTLKIDIAKNDDSVCTICQQNVKSGEKYVTLSCEHIFHADTECCLGNNQSIYTWFEKSHKCPNCNKDIQIE